MCCISEPATCGHLDNPDPAAPVEPGSRWQAHGLQDSRLKDVLLPPANCKADGHSSPFKLHECFEELPNWLIACSQFPPLPPAQKGMYGDAQLDYILYSAVGLRRVCACFV